ncbi:MAG: polyprenyl synthetase family protein [Kiritimatiellae bacterium]|nr:polyprenyl synthetase family protein [Kiritimatiellia bacterium]
MEYLEIVERTLDEVLPKPWERPAELSEAMRYAVGTGGKRIRPLICLASAVAVGGSAEDARYPAAAIELLHNYTLVHDDLPAMDNDTERRGKPTVWTKFGEANAILVGDALQALAFEAAANAPRNVAEIVAALGAAGVGVVQGQVEDLKRESGTDGTAGGPAPLGRVNGTDGASGSPAPLPMELVDFVYTHKTADLFVAAAAMGGYAGGGDAASVEKLRTFALNLGLAFQYEDDLLDGDSPYSREKTEALVRETTAASIAALAELPGDTSFLKALAEKLVGRSV